MSLPGGGINGAFRGLYCKGTNHSQRPPYPNIITLAVRYLRYEFWENTNIQSVPVSQVVDALKL